MRCYDDIPIANHIVPERVTSLPLAIITRSYSFAYPRVKNDKSNNYIRSHFSDSILMIICINNCYRRPKMTENINLQWINEYACYYYMVWISDEYTWLFIISSQNIHVCIIDRVLVSTRKLSVQNKKYPPNITVRLLSTYLCLF